MEGRDIGSVVFPSAELKLFITASFPRVERRYKELKLINSKITKQYVTKNIKKRDLIDKNRKHSPLIRVKDSILIDNSNMTIFEQVLIKNYIKKKHIKKLVKVKKNLLLLSLCEEKHYFS